MFAIVNSGVPQIVDQGSPLVRNSVQHPPNIFQLWSEAELRAIGIYKIQTDPVPPGKRVTGSSLYFNGTNVVQVDTYEDLPPPPVPQSVTRRQIRRALHQLDFLDNIQAFIDQAGPDVKIDWEDANTFRRDYPFLEEARVLMGLSKEQVDDLFRLAATFE